MGKREVDKAKTAKALRKLRRVAELAAAPDAPKLTSWEQDFVAGVSTRLETYGSAFRDLSKGRAEEALSERQAVVARVIAKKTRPKKPKADSAPGAAQTAGKPSKGAEGFRRSSFKPKAPPPSRARVRHVEDDLPDPTPPQLLKLVAAPRLSAPKAAQPPASTPSPKPQLRVIRGGRPDKASR